MTWLLAVGFFCSMSAGVYLLLSRHLLRCVVGLSIMAASVNFVVFSAARPKTTTPPIVPDGGRVLDLTLNPLPQALVLTAVVIGFALTCFALVLVLAIKQRTGLSDSQELREAEPPPQADGSPAQESEREQEDAEQDQEDASR